MERSDMINTSTNKTSTTDDGNSYDASVIEIVPNITVIDLDNYEYSEKSPQDTPGAPHAAPNTSIKQEAPWSLDHEPSPSMVLEDPEPVNLDPREDAIIVKTELTMSEQVDIEEEKKIKLSQSMIDALDRPIKSSPGFNKVQIKERRSSVAEMYPKNVKQSISISEEAVKEEKDEALSIIKEEGEDMSFCDEALGTSQIKLTVVSCNDDGAEQENTDAVTSQKGDLDVAKKVTLCGAQDSIDKVTNQEGNLDVTKKATLCGTQDSSDKVTNQEGDLDVTQKARLCGTQDSIDKVRNQEGDLDVIKKATLCGNQDSIDKVTNQEGDFDVIKKATLCGTQDTIDKSKCVNGLELENDHETKLSSHTDKNVENITSAKTNKHTYADADVVAVGGCETKSEAICNVAEVVEDNKRHGNVSSISSANINENDNEDRLTLPVCSREALALKSVSAPTPHCDQNIRNNAPDMIVKNAVGNDKLLKNANNVDDEGNQNTSPLDEGKTCVVIKSVNENSMSNDGVSRTDERSQEGNASQLIEGSDKPNTGDMKCNRKTAESVKPKGNASQLIEGSDKPNTGDAECCRKTGVKPKGTASQLIEGSDKPNTGDVERCRKIVVKPKGNASQFIEGCDQPNTGDVEQFRKTGVKPSVIETLTGISTKSSHKTDKRLAAGNSKTPIKRKVVGKPAETNTKISVTPNGTEKGSDNLLKTPSTSKSGLKSKSLTTGNSRELIEGETSILDKTASERSSINSKTSSVRVSDEHVFGSSLDQKDELFELSIINDLEEFEKKDFPCSTPKPSQKSTGQITKKPSSAEDRHVWIYSINPCTTAGQLKRDLSKYGKVLVAKIVTNGDKYFGYALMEKAEYAKSCIEKLAGKSMDGYEVDVSSEPPHKKRAYAKAAPKKQPEKKVEKREHQKPRKRSRSQDPLTLKVDAKKRYRRSRSRSDSRRRRALLQREEEARQRKQREMEIQIENEKLKLEQEKRDFEKQKTEFARWQKNIEDENRARAEREKLAKAEIRAREEYLQRCRKQSRSPARKAGPPWRRSKTHSPARKLGKIEKVSSNVRMRVTKCADLPPRARPKSSQQPRHEFRDAKRSVSPKREKRDRRDERIDPPPAPRLTNEDLIRNKVDPWKTGLEPKKARVEYYRNKDEFNLDTNRAPGTYRDSRPVNRSEYDRKGCRGNSYDRKYSDTFGDKYGRDDDKYKENKKRGYDANCKPPNVRSEVYAIQPRTNMAYSSGSDGVRRFDSVTYPVQYSRNYVTPNPMQYHNQPLQHPNPPTALNWSSRPMYAKDYIPTAQPKPPFHQDHPKYEEYDKRHPYFPQRKY